MLLLVVVPKTFCGLRVQTLEAIHIIKTVAAACVGTPVKTSYVSTTTEWSEVSDVLGWVLLKVYDSVDAYLHDCSPLVVLNTSKQTSLSVSSGILMKS
jgi:hypothetical protein